MIVKGPLEDVGKSSSIKSHKKQGNVHRVRSIGDVLPTSGNDDSKAYLCP